MNLRYYSYLGFTATPTTDPIFLSHFLSNRATASINVQPFNHLQISFVSLVKNCNHKGLGIYYLLSAFIFGISGTLISVCLRIELYSSGNRIISPENQNFYNISITLHGFLMIFFLVMPGLFGGFGNYFVPIFQGSPEVVYPRVNNFSILILSLSYLFVILSFGNPPLLQLKTSSAFFGAVFLLMFQTLQLFKHMKAFRSFIPLTASTFPFSSYFHLVKYRRKVKIVTCRRLDADPLPKTMESAWRSLETTWIPEECSFLWSSSPNLVNKQTTRN